MFGNVTVTNDANITAAAGDGIRAYNFGTGNVTVTDEANTTIQTTGANGQYGIEGKSAERGQYLGGDVRNRHGQFRRSRY